jgi:hypothetical protein
MSRPSSGVDRHRPWPVEAPAAVRSTYCFTLKAVADPGVMPRVLELFAKRGLIPSRWHSMVVGPDELHVDLQMAGLEPATGDLVAAAMRQIVGVDYVLTSLKATAEASAMDRVA